MRACIRLRLVGELLHLGFASKSSFRFLCIKIQICWGRSLARRHCVRGHVKYACRLAVQCCVQALLLLLRGDTEADSFLEDLANYPGPDRSPHCCHSYCHGLPEQQVAATAEEEAIDVYDTTNYLKKHPGGVTSITMNGGEDCTEEFTSIHSKKAWDDLEEWRIGFTVEAKDDASRMTYSKSSTHLLTEAYERAEAAAGKAIERVEHDLVALNPKKWLSFPLTEKIVMSPDTALFRFALPSPDHRTGLPTGWHIFLRYRDAKGSLVMRAYTPTSLNTELGVVDFVIKVYRPCDRFPDGGKMSQYIDTLQIGDGLEMRGPVGHFEYVSAGSIVLNGESLSGKKFGFMCGGTGISPAYQVIKYSLTTEPDADVSFCLVYGNQTPGDILLKEEIDLLAAAHPQRLTVHYTVDRIDDDAKAEWADASFSVGFIDTQMCEKILGRDCDFVGVCGPPGMIKFACKPALQELGYGDDEIGKQSEDSTQPSKYFLF